MSTENKIETSTATGKKNKDGLIGGCLVTPQELALVKRQKHKSVVATQEKQTKTDK